MRRPQGVQMNTVKKIINEPGKLALAVTLILISIGVAFGTLGVYHQQPAPPQKLVWKKSANSEPDNAVDQRLLVDKARTAGKYVGIEYPPNLNKFKTLNDLVSAADSIVIATALKNVCKPSGDGKTVTIDYEMTVEHAYKGNLSSGKTISVSIPGGLVKFADGTSAEIRTPWFKKMTNRSTYLLFLNNHGNGRLTITGGPRGLFGIPTTASNRKVVPHSLIEGDPMQSYSDTDVIVFLRAVKQAVSQKM